MNYKEQKEYKVTLGVLNDLNMEGRIKAFQGKCLAAADIIQATLDARGVRCKTLECNLVVVNGRNTPGSISFVGFDSVDEVAPEDVDTHVVVLVEAAQPFIVDASVGHIAGDDKYVVVTPLTSTDPDIIAETTFKGVRMVYRVKKNIRLTGIHQKNLMNRLMDDQRIRKEVTLLNKLVWVGLAIGAANVIFNVSAIFLRLLTL